MKLLACFSPIHLHLGKLQKNKKKRIARKESGQQINQQQKPLAAV